MNSIYFGVVLVEIVLINISVKEKINSDYTLSVKY